MEDLELEEFFEDFPEELERSDEVEELEDSLSDLEEPTEEVSSTESVEDESREGKDVALDDSKGKVDHGVERYSSTTLSYPCFILDSKTEFPKHVISALSRMIESSLSLENLIKVYIRNGEELLSLGGISSVQVKATIDLLGRENIEGYFSKDYPLSGDLIYVLSS